MLKLFANGMDKVPHLISATLLHVTLQVHTSPPAYCILLDFIPHYPKFGTRYLKHGADHSRLLHVLGAY